MATEAARLERKESTERKKEKRENTLDSYRPSHGRTFVIILSRLFGSHRMNKSTLCHAIGQSTHGIGRDISYSITARSFG
jgi:hypothetical protein